jgi:hypothetical protein
VVSGNTQTPTRTVSAQIEARPTWTDPPGRYEGHLTLSGGPFIDENARRKDRIWFSPIEDHQINVSLEIPEIILVSMESVELDFSALLGPGEYTATQEVRFHVTSNAEYWRVECEAAPLVCDDYEIPPDRVKWSRLDERGVESSVYSIGEKSTLAEGHGSTQDREFRVRFRLDILPIDRAGSYKGKISLVGLTGL